MKLLSLFSTIALASTVAFASPIPQYSTTTSAAAAATTGGLEGKGSTHAEPGLPHCTLEADGSGIGYLADCTGGGPPSWAPSDWLYYGKTVGWAPDPVWTPYAEWEAPIEFVSKWVEVTWWTPPSDWKDYYNAHWLSTWYDYAVPVAWGWLPEGQGAGSWVIEGKGYVWKKESSSRERRGVARTQ